MSGAYFINVGGTRKIGSDNVELDALDGSTQYIASVGSAITLNRNANAGKTFLLDRLTGITVTLPEATGSGDRYKFLQTVIPTSLNNIVQVTTTDTFVGILLTLDDTNDNVLGWIASGTSDTITLDRTTKGGSAIGEWFEFTDVADALWEIRGVTYGTGSSETPFSAAVS